MTRALAYLLLGWSLIAIVGGLADVLHLTVMLPATSVIVITHLAFTRGSTLVFGLSLAIALGYLEDLHQGAPVGTLTLVHAITFLALRWASGRLHTEGWIMRALASCAAVIVLDLLTWAVLWLLAEPLELRREAVTHSLLAIRWHALATLLAGPPIWMLIDRVFGLLRIDEKPAQKVHWGGS